MNMPNLAKTSEKLHIVRQIKWKNEALKVRERKGFPTLEDLVEIFERRSEAANDPDFRRVGETNTILSKKEPKSQLTSITSES